MKKNIIFFLLLFASSLVSQTNNQIQKIPFNSVKKNITGTWYYEINSKENELLNGTFTLNLKVVNRKLIGNYCAVARNGNKIDCTIDEENNITGKLKGKKYLIEFYSFFGARGGKAIIELIDSNTIKWKIIKAPKGECYAPYNCILIKINK